MEKIRIFSLAKELDIDNKRLIDLCQQLGIVVKNSALASISPEERDKVVALYKKGGGAPVATSAPAAPRPEAAPVPVREPVRPVTGGKVPAIRSMTPRPMGISTAVKEVASVAVAVASTSSVATVAADEVATDEVAEQEASVAEPDVEDSTVEAVESETDDTSGESETVADATESPLDSGPAVSAPAVSGTDADAATVGTATVTAPAATERPPMKPGPLSRGSGTGSTLPPPLRKSDYISASGTQTGRPMAGKDSAKPEEGGDTVRAPKKPKGRPGPALPTLASPPPPPKAPMVSRGGFSEGPAQKPDMRFSTETLSAAKGQPLQAALKKTMEERKANKKPGTPGAVEDERAGRGARGAGAGLTDVREMRLKGGRGKSRPNMDDDDGRPGRRAPKMKRRQGSVELKSSAEIEFPITVRSLSEAIGRPANLLLKSLMQQGTMATVNSSLEEDQALELCLELGIDLKIKREQDIEERFDELMGDTGGEKVIRPPIITIMGHVDHGKTTLLDKIRSANVAAGEIGGITQHIAAYQVEHNGRRITFLDTPGHAAFGEMRARGANVTDIAVLVVAANDGVMPQTIEALNHARAAEVPIVVAMNKIDLPEKNEQRVLQELATQNLLAAEWGGDTEVVRTSGQSGEGIDTLLETLLTVADLNEWKADPDRDAYGVCLEAFRDEGRGPIAWLVIQEGTLRKGDVLVCGQAHGRIRNMYDDHDQEIEEAGPSTPVKVTGLDIVPGAGDKFSVLDDIEEAREIANTRAARVREGELAQKNSRPQTIEDVLNAAQGGGVKNLPVILKADTPGSLEALKGELGKFDHPEVKVQILHTGVGGVNESDVLLASASKAIVVAFHVIPEDRAEQLAEREGVVIRQYGIIYEITDDIKLALEGLLPPERVEVPTGRAIVLQTFSISRVGTIAGCRVLNGTIERSSRIRLIRDQRVLNDYDISSLKRVKDDAKEVREGQECGIRLQGFDDIKEGDMFQAFKITEVKRTL